ncbi:phage tail protein [Asticcacaulis machinosus]|uniref:Phage tail protein n=1 Tax=Asticcacaulis machinosus TaxID=2984211 RepID=A0ABT5HGP9_9CAUL|nr:phage tail protein [Asticcacaulis machinosus]MDC7675372.1 phage tail protein [Asticcacaulis machinosus]
MDKTTAVRDFIEGSVPELKRNPDRLRIFIRTGSVALRYSNDHHGYQYNYVLNIEVRDFGGHPDQVFLPLALWLRRYQPDLLLNHDRANRAISYQADFLDNKSVDLDITIDLTESVDVTPFEDGFKITHRDDALDNDAANVALKKIYDQDGKFIAGYPSMYFLTGVGGDHLLGTDGAALKEINLYE